MKNQELKETFLVVSVLTFIFLPIRILFVTYISDNWFGSFGLITVVIITLIILAKKNKLGKFGTLFIKHLFKIHRGKRKYYVYFTLISTTLFFGTVIYSIETARANYSIELEELQELLPDPPNLENPEQTTEFINEMMPQLTPEQVFLSLIFMIFLPLENLDAFFLLWGLTDQATNGWYLHFSTVIFIENLEMTGILIYTRLTIKNNPTIL